MRNFFNLRVYGIFIHNNSILVSDEYIKGNKITKFPGGGLEFGEGTKDCLKREFIEELNLEIEVIEHFYTTDFFVKSFFDENSQVVSIYYLVKPISKLDFKTSDTPHNYEKKEGAQALRWISCKDFKESELTLLIDQFVAKLIINLINTI